MTKRSALPIPADPVVLYEILTDYERLAEWLPQVSRGRLLAGEGDLALVELELRGRENTRFAMECIHSRDQMVVWRPVEKRIPVTEFRWELEPAGDGQCRVSAMAKRPLSLSLRSQDLRQFLEPGTCLKALHDQAPVFTPDDKLAEGCEKILEIVETESGLICWLRGRKYRLVPDTK